MSISSFFFFLETYHLINFSLGGNKKGVRDFIGECQNSSEI